MAPPRPGPWFQPMVARLRFELELSAAGDRFRGWMTRSRQPGPGYELRGRVSPFGLGPVEVRIVFTGRMPTMPHVYVAGPNDSPHRYADGALCMWYPRDPPEAQWTLANGPLALLGHIAAHLLREDFWRRTGEWPGEEAPHRLATRRRKRTPASPRPLTKGINP